MSDGRGYPRSETARVENLARALEHWSEGPREGHCEDCAHCKVSGLPWRPVAHCDRGHDRTGTGRELVRMIRKGGSGFVTRYGCPDFKSMGGPGLAELADLYANWPGRRS